MWVKEVSMGRWEERNNEEVLEFGTKEGGRGEDLGKLDRGRRRM